MSDLAKLAGVSKSTVSRALADSERVTKETRERIKALAAEHNYRLNSRARNFRTQERLTIGVLLPSTGSGGWLSSDSFVLEMLGSIADALEEAGGHELLLAKHSSEDPKWIENFHNARNVDGIIVVGQSVFHEQLNRLAESETRMVVWGTEIPGQKYISIGSENQLGGYDATKHLIHQGRTRIAFIGDTDHPEIKSRSTGYRKALSEHGLEPIGGTENLVRYSNQINREAFQKFLLDSKPDAIFAAFDILAIHSISLVLNAGLKVPQDVAVVGFDNITLAKHFNPSLTTVNQNRQLAGRLLVQKLMDLIEFGETTPTIIKNDLIVRESSAG